MKFYKLIIILVIFFKTETVLSKENIFNVNNIEIEIKSNISNNDLANLAIKKGFDELSKKILLDRDRIQLTKLNLSQIKDLVSYYQVKSRSRKINEPNTITYNIFFDKTKLHNLFYNQGILYSEIENNELYLLPILRKNDQIFVYNGNFFYEKWNDINNSDLLEFILPIENIEVIQTINSNRNNLLDLNLNTLFQEYSKKNLVLLLIEDSGAKKEKIYLRSKILGKNIDKNLIINREKSDEKLFYKKIIFVSTKEIINLVKSQNLIDVRTPSFLNTKMTINKNNNLFELNKRLKNIDLIDNIFVQEFNSDEVLLKIKYLGKLDKIIQSLEEQKIILKLLQDQWSIKLI